MANVLMDPKVLPGPKTEWRGGPKAIGRVGRKEASWKDCSIQLSNPIPGPLPHDEQPLFSELPRLLLAVRMHVADAANLPDVIRQTMGSERRFSRVHWSQQADAYRSWLERWQSTIQQEHAICHRRVILESISTHQNQQQERVSFRDG